MSKKLKITRGSGNVFADIGFDKDEAENLKLRAELMMRPLAEVDKDEQWARVDGTIPAQE